MKLMAPYYGGGLLSDVDLLNPEFAHDELSCSLGLPATQVSDGCPVRGVQSLFERV
jgi:hypothetical protein